MARRRVAIGTNFGSTSRCLNGASIPRESVAVPCLIPASDFHFPVSRARELSPPRDMTIRTESGAIPACMYARELFEFEVRRTTAYFRPIVSVAPLAVARLNAKEGFPLSR